MPRCEKVQMACKRPGLRSNTRIDDEEVSQLITGDKHVANGKSFVKLKGKSRDQKKAPHSVRDETRSLVLWKRPIVTLKFFFLEVFQLLYESIVWFLKHYKITLFILLDIILVISVWNIDGPHQKYLSVVQGKLLWCGYWIGLGILSSVGLGTGLHTFLLYLGPHIASVTLAAYECGNLDFPEPPYPEEIVCSADSNATGSVTIFHIMSKVRLEAFMWGAGTALGELPPYFMARASRLSGQALSEIEDGIENSQDAQYENSSHQSFLQRARQSVKILVERVGFFGIMACASIPNPLFDLAGITCGHFLIPFWTFFGATLIGKAIIKMHIQKLFVIVAFSEHHVESSVDLIKDWIPYIGKYLHQPFREFLSTQKASLHRKAGTRLIKKASWLSWIFEKLVTGMIVYFVISIINSMAQDYAKRSEKKTTSRTKKVAND